MDRFVQTLLFSDMRLAFSKWARRYLELFAKYYCESKTIFKAEKDRSHPSTRNCGCFFNFQPRERIKEDKAYKDLADEANELTSTTVLTLGSLYLKGLKLNNEDRKKELIETLSSAMADFASLVLLEHEMEGIYEHHDLVADLLLKHHHELLESKTSVEFFTTCYRRVNNCGHPPKDKDELFKHRLPPDAKTTQNPTTSKQTAAAATPANHPTGMSKATSATPSVARAINFDSVTSDVMKGISGSSYISASQMLAIQNTISAILTAGPVNQITQQGAPPSPATLILPAYAGAKPCFNKNTDAEDQLMIEECDRALNEQELKEKKEAQLKALKVARLKECTILTRIDSIRSRSTLGIPTPPPDSNTPPKFPSISTNESTTSTNESTIKTSTTDTSFINHVARAPSGTKDAPLEIDVVPEPSMIALKKVDSTDAVATLWTAVYTCFVKAPSMFVHQHMYNAKANKMATFSAAKNLERHADKTAEILVVDGGPSGKVASFAASVTNRKVTETVKRKTQASDDSLRAQLQELQQESKKMKRELSQEKNKRIKLEATLKKQETKSPSNSKESGGPTKGAHKRNQTGKPKGPPNQRDKKASNRGNTAQQRADDASTEANAESGRQHKQRNKKYFQTKKSKTWRKPSAN